MKLPFAATPALPSTWNMTTAECLASASRPIAGSEMYQRLARLDYLSPGIAD
jgi:hypothetical protein